MYRGFCLVHFVTLFCLSIFRLSCVIQAHFLNTLMTFCFFPLLLLLLQSGACCWLCTCLLQQWQCDHFEADPMRIFITISLFLQLVIQSIGLSCTVFANIPLTLSNVVNEDTKYEKTRHSDFLYLFNSFIQDKRYILDIQIESSRFSRNKFFR